MLTGLLALTSAAMFAGVAVYVLLCEQPARLALDDRALLMEFKPSYKHGTIMQAPLAVLGCVLGLIAWWQNGRWPWLAGAVAIGAALPYTLLVIFPTNNRLVATDIADAGPGTRALIEHWGRLHAGRAALGVLAVLLFLWASIGSAGTA